MFQIICLCTCIMTNYNFIFFFNYFYFYFEIYFDSILFCFFELILCRYHVKMYLPILIIFYCFFFKNFLLNKFFAVLVSPIMRIFGYCQSFGTKRPRIFVVIFDSYVWWLVVDLHLLTREVHSCSY